MNVDQVLNITLTAGELNVVLTLVGKGPYEVVAPIIEKLHRQVLAADPTAFSPSPGLNGTGLVEPTPVPQGAGGGGRGGPGRDSVAEGE